MRITFNLLIILITSSLLLAQEQTINEDNTNKKEEQVCQDEKISADDCSAKQENEEQTCDNDKTEKENQDEKVDENNSDTNQGEDTDSQKDDEVFENQNESEQRITFVGKLLKTKPLTLKKPSEYALEDGYLYKSTDYYIGNFNVYSDHKNDISEFANKIIVAHGYLEQDLNKIITIIGECPENYGQEESMMQIRNDWVSEETGFSVGHSTIEKLKNVYFFNYNRVKEYRSFRLKKYTDTKKVEIVFHNTLGKSIDGLTLIAHYESVFGKPVPMTQDKVFSYLAPGEKASFIVPVMISSIKKYELQSVKVVADNETIKIEIEEDYKE